MAATKTTNCNEHFSVEKLKEWPEPESVSLMEVLAREDIDEAVHAILFRENYIVKTKASPLCECLLRRQQELREAKGASYQHGTGKQNDTQKTPKGTGKAPLFSRPPQAMLIPRAVAPKERQRTSARSVLNKSSDKSRGTCSSEKLVCTSKPHLSREATSSPSQLAFERQFRSWKLSQEIKEAEKQGPVLGTREAADSQHSQGPSALGRKVMTAELLGKHLASLQGVARSGLHRP
ncbi:protein FAM228A isoform X3 [Mesocricetus auratus]|uniref:Protein FAM228A isoform X3 n=1 Tax=Mesocricetus auratus TaxID=10036 RepID=A0ABM2WFR0_MESAU|nr:protein FAM228A isoform X3 [Mesocricetus auratus]